MRVVVTDCLRARESVGSRFAEMMIKDEFDACVIEVVVKVKL